MAAATSRAAGRSRNSRLAPANPHRVVVLEFPDMGQLKAFYNSPEYRPLIALRQRSARSSLFAVEGV
jgi:uncharacterized protein (DUF1330 family)